MSKPIFLYKLSPAQIALVDRLAGSELGVLMDALEYGEMVAYQELAKLGFVDMVVKPRRRAAIALTEPGRQVRTNGYFSRKPVLRLTEPQVMALRFISGSKGGRRFNEIPSTMIDVCRRMGLRGWIEWRENRPGGRHACLTEEGRHILMLVDV